MLRPLVIVGLALTLITTSRAQIDQSEAFPGLGPPSLGTGDSGGFWDTQGGATGAAGGEAGAAAIRFKLPSAVPVRRPLRLRPPRPVLVVAAPKRASDSVLNRLNGERRTILERIKALRAHGDQAGVVALMRDLEQLRQDRLSRVREIGTPTVPAPQPVERAGAIPVLPLSAPTVPVLPIPTLPSNR